MFDRVHRIAARLHFKINLRILHNTLSPASKDCSHHVAHEKLHFSSFLQGDGTVAYINFSRSIHPQMGA
jgi:hypothetical protein